MNKSKLELYKSVFKTTIVNKDGYSAESIPVGNAEKVDTLFAQMQPIEFVNEVLLGDEHPIDDWLGPIILTEEWAKTFAQAVNTVPGFVYLKGHEDIEPYKRAIPSGYIVGAKVEKDRLLLRNRLLMRESVEGRELVEQTMRELNAGVHSTSTGDIQKRRVEYNEEEHTWKQFAVESIKNQTNAIVEHDMHASDASVVSTNFKIAYYDENNKLIMIDPSSSEEDTKFKGDIHMKFQEYVEGIKTSLKSGEGTIETLLKALDIEILSDEHKASITKLKSVEQRVGGDIVKYLDEQDKAKKVNFKATVEAKLKDAFKDADVYDIAQSLCKFVGDDVAPVEDAKVDEEITRLKAHKSVQKMQTLLASSVGYVPHAGIGDDEATDQNSSESMEA